MTDRLQTPCTAFDCSRRIASGPLGEVALAVKAYLEAHLEAAVLVFDDVTGQVMDLDLRGTPREVLARLAPAATGFETAVEVPRGRGRPKLGIVAREVTLLPRHWDWLNAQPGGASVTLRKLVEAARRGGGDDRRQAQERTYRFMAALGGNEPGFEAALRALYALDAMAFDAHTQAWPADVRDHARTLARPAFTAVS